MKQTQAAKDWEKTFKRILHEASVKRGNSIMQIAKTAKEVNKPWPKAHSITPLSAAAAAPSASRPRSVFGGLGSGIFD